MSRAPARRGRLPHHSATRHCQGREAGCRWRLLISSYILRTGGVESPKRKPRECANTPGRDQRSALPGGEMPVVTLYRHGVSMGVPPMTSTHKRAKRDVVTGWSAGATRRNLRFLYSID